MLSRRARIALAPEPAATSDSQSATAQPAPPGDELGLTPREREVLALVAEGRTNRQIAEALFISDRPFLAAAGSSKNLAYAVGRAGGL